MYEEVDIDLDVDFQHSDGTLLRQADTTFHTLCCASICHVPMKMATQEEQQIQLFCQSLLTLR